MFENKPTLFFLKTERLSSQLLVFNAQPTRYRYGYLKAIHISKLTHYYKIKLGLLTP